MLDAMRKNTKVVLWILVFAFVALIFLVWGADSQMGCGQAQGVVGRVNGEAITLDQFNRVLQTNRDSFRTTRGSEPGPGDEARMFTQTWDSIIEQMLLSQEAKRMGFTPTDEELLLARTEPPQAIRQEPTFQTDGRFDAQKYQQLINDPNIDPAFFVQLEAMYRELIPVERLTMLVYSGARVSEAEIRRAFHDRNEQARVTYRLFDMRTYPLEDTVTAAEAEAYFKAHPEEFRLPPQSTIRYARFERTPTEQDLEDYRLQLADYAAIARRYIAGDSTALSFAMLAETYSDLPSAVEGGFEDRFYGRGELTPELEQVAFSLPAGAISDPIRDRAGFHIIQVDSVLMDGVDTRVRFRDLMVKVEASPATVADMEEKIANIRTEAAKKGLKAPVEAAGASIVEPPPFAEGTYVRGLESVPGVVEWAFKARPGDISGRFETNDAWYVAELVARHDNKNPTFKDNQALARQKATEARQRERARADAESFLAQVRGAESWRVAAGADSSQIRTVGPFSRVAGVPGLGREAEVLAAAFGLSPGSVSGPLKSTRGVVVLKVDERTPADESLLEAQRTQIEQQLLIQRRNEMYQDWLTQLKKKAEIKDYRDLYFTS